MGEVRLVASDIDGTLIMNHDSHGINPRVFDEIRELKRRGVVFVVASGRQYYGLTKLFAPVANDIVYLCENGTLVRDARDLRRTSARNGEDGVRVGRMRTDGARDDGTKGADGRDDMRVLMRNSGTGTQAESGDDARVLVKDSMPRDLALELCHEIVSYPGLSLLADGPSEAYILERDQWLTDRLRVTNDEVVVPIKSPDDIDGELIKVAFYAPPELMDEAFAYFERRSLGRYQVTVSGSTWVDLLPVGANKGTGLKKAGEALGIAPSQMMAFGDNFNDAEMLDLVGHPYLMASGQEKLRTLNDRIHLCKSVDGQLAALLEEPGVF